MSAPERSGLIVPIVLWGGNPPSNRIAHIATLCNGQVIVTGTLDGQATLFTYNSDINLSFVDCTMDGGRELKLDPAAVNVTCP